jgi:subtilisin family serine protease
LLDNLRARAQKGALPQGKTAPSTLDLKAGDKVKVRIRGSVTPALQTEIARLGGTVHATDPESHVLSAVVPLDAIEPLAAQSDVTAIERAPKGRRNWFENQEGTVAHAVVNALKDTHNSGVDGSGVKVCVLSDSVRYLSKAQENFTLGDVTVLPGQDGVQKNGGDGGEGTAMLEIIHSIAPGAELMFATDEDEVQMPNNIKALAGKKCNIIVDDQTYGDEFPFQDDEISKAVNEVTGQNILSVTSAGNQGSYEAGTSQAWEGPFQGGTVNSDGSINHVFDPKDKQNGEYNIVLGDCQSKSIYLNLFWNDLLPSSKNISPANLSDYELFVFDAKGTPLPDTTTGSPGKKPWRWVEVPAADDKRFDHTVQIKIVEASGKGDKFLHLDTSCGSLKHSTYGAILGHNAAESAVSVAASSFPTTDKGDPIPFTGKEKGVEVSPHSGEGPRRVFFHEDGKPYNKDLQKPDVTAFEGVTTDVPKMERFSGTSAAAPQVAGIAALIWSKDRKLTAEEIKEILRKSAIQIVGNSGWNRRSGFGIVNAEAALLLSKR